MFIHLFVDQLNAACGSETDVWRVKFFFLVGCRLSQKVVITFLFRLATFGTKLKTNYDFHGIKEAYRSFDNGLLLSVRSGRLRERVRRK